MFESKHVETVSGRIGATGFEASSNSDEHSSQGGREKGWGEFFQGRGGRNDGGREKGGGRR